MRSFYDWLVETRLKVSVTSQCEVGTAYPQKRISRGFPFPHINTIISLIRLFAQQIPSKHIVYVASMSVSHCIVYVACSFMKLSLPYWLVGMQFSCKYWMLSPSGFIKASTLLPELVWFLNFQRRTFNLAVELWDWNINMKLALSWQNSLRSSTSRESSPSQCEANLNWHQPRDVGDFVSSYSARVLAKVIKFLSDFKLN